MKHKTIITRLCYFLNEGYGIHESLHELGLTIDYLAKRCRRTDRVKLRQAHAIYVESLQREIVNRARLGRDITRLERALNNLPPLSLPGDDADEERAHRSWERRNFEDDDMSTELFPSDLTGLHRFLSIDDEDEDAAEADEQEAIPEAPSAPHTSPQASVTPFAAISSRPPEDAHQRGPEPAPAPELHWYRLFTGRAVQRDGDGKVVRSAMPGAYDYPSPLEFVNWN